MKRTKRDAVERAKGQAEPTAKKPLDRAKPEWLPLHAAMMRFFPTYASEKAFPAELKRLVVTLAGKDSFSVAEVAAFVVRIVWDGVGLVIDAERGEIEIEAEVDGDDWGTIFDDFVGMRARSNQFPMEFPASAVRPQFREAASRQHDLALRLIWSFKASFREAVDDGGAEIFGRWRDLKAAFEPVYPDVWHRLAETPGADWSPGTDMSTFTVDGRRGDLTIYSIHVNPHRKQVSASNRASIACRAFFVEEIRQRLPNGRVNQTELKNTARDRWPREDLPDRQITSCLRAAISETNSMGLVRPGRPPKLIHSTR